jgi:phosphoribosylaminoimidazolecarboxamide formyltransferase/IMP cyclohydrolase
MVRNRKDVLFMKELELKYGCNPNQKPARIFMERGDLPLQVLNGRPGYINFMDALNAWQLVQALRQATGLPAAASFKHVSPAGAALGLPLSEVERQIYFAPEGALSPIACAYIRARGADRLCSFGDWAALSDVCDADTANFLAGEVSDGVIAPGYTDEALRILRAKRQGGYNVIQIDPDYRPAPVERRNIFGLTFEQGYNDLAITEELLNNLVTDNKELPQQAKNDMLLALITLKYTQSNSVCYVKNGQTIGVGAGQQSRIHCTRLAGNKADLWWLRQHPKALALQFVPGIRRPDRDNAIDLYLSEEWGDVLADGVWQNIFQTKPEVLTTEEKQAWIAQLSGVTVGSDAFFPFGDNIERAHKSGADYIVQPGGSIRDEQVIATANKYHMVMAFTGVRLFHH